MQEVKIANRSEKSWRRRERRIGGEGTKERKKRGKVERRRVEEKERRRKEEKKRRKEGVK